VVRRAGAVGVRELYVAGDPGRPLHRPAEGRLADRLE
jgi:hypothetical protein